MREHYIDIVKGWAIITIVLFHIFFYDGGTLTKTLYSYFGNQWNVPMFFLLAGYFISHRQLVQPKEFLKKKFHTLYLPTTIIYLIMILLHNVFVNIGWYSPISGKAVTGSTYTIYSAGDYATSCIKALLCGGSGELAMGAMWFLYVLIYAFIALSVISWAATKVTADTKKQIALTAAIIFVAAAISNIATRLFGFTIERVSSTFSILPLILIGWAMNKWIKLKYNNTYLFVAACLLFAYTTTMNRVHISIAINKYDNLFTLIAGSVAALYICCYVAKKIENGIIGRGLAFVGRNSFYIMALHIVGFFICNSLLEQMGIFDSSSPRALYTYRLNGSVSLTALYLLAGVAFPLSVTAIINFVRSRRR